MADNESDRPPNSPENSESDEKQGKQEPETGISESESKSDGSSKDEDSLNRDGAASKEEELDNRGAYTAGTRGFPPSRFTPRGPVFGSSSHFGGNPFAVKSPSMSKNSMDGGHSGEGGSLWPGLTPSKLGGGGAAGSAVTPPSRPVLRPPQLSSPALGTSGSPAVRSSEATPPRSSFPLNPPRLGNPFGKGTVPHTEGEEGRESVASEKSEKASAAEESLTPATSAVPPTTSSQTPVKFVPLGTPTSSNSQDSSTSSLTSTPKTSTSFVFGQNLHERVVESAPNHVAPSTSKQTENGTAEPSSSTPTTNGTSSEMLFSAGLKKEPAQEANNDSGGETPAKSLSEAAREYEESRAVKRKYEAVAVMTGEEEETNVLQISCKLYAYDKANGSWAERGRGQLRLNDKVDRGGTGGGLQSRVIMRTHGSLRVVLNTKVWPGMVVDRANSKSVRLTAMDNDQIKVFLVQATVKEAENLHTALERRVSSQRSRAPATSDCPSPCSPGSPQPEVAVEEARSGLESSSFPGTEPSSKKGRSSQGSAPPTSGSDHSEDGQDVEL